MTSRTRLTGTGLYRAAQAIQLRDCRRRYHNRDHVERLCRHTGNTFEMPYDADLDQAILAHDVICDAGPGKEGRSADWLGGRSHLPTREARRHIMKTLEHPPGRDNRIILLDLADMLFEDRIGVNPSPRRGCSDADFAAANRVSMTRPRDRILGFPPGAVSTSDRVAFRGFAPGISRVLDLALDRLPPGPRRASARSRGART